MEVDSHFPPLTLKKEGFSEWAHLLVLQKNDMRMLGTHTRGRPSSGFQHLDEFIILDLLILKLAHASACLDAGDGVHTS